MCIITEEPCQLKSLYLYAGRLVLNWRCEASVVRGRLASKWQLDQTTKRFLSCFLAKATWYINMGLQLCRDVFLAAYKCYNWHCSLVILLFVGITHQ